ncbi:MAG: SDR family NAD(P)-dependent oxidoreductase [Betaproteobacteria bacterium]
MDAPDTVIITGAAGNLGRAVAAAFAERGALLVLVDRSREHLQSAFGDENDRRLYAVADLLDPESVNAMARTSLDRAQRIDILCNLAGGFRMGDALHETSDASWDFLLDVNARTLLHTARAVVPHMIAAGGGRIVNVGAYAAQRGAARMAAYVASKSAVIRMTEAMSAELREKNINVNCVLPTTLDTPENRRAMPDVDPSRWVAPADLAQVIVFLASPQARAVHGAAIPVTGLS